MARRKLGPSEAGEVRTLLHLLDLAHLWCQDGPEIQLPRVLTMLDRVTGDPGSERTRRRMWGRLLTRLRREWGAHVSIREERHLGDSAAASILTTSYVWPSSDAHRVRTAIGWRLDRRAHIVA